MTIFADFSHYVDAALDALEAAGQLPAGLPRGNVSVEPPRDMAHGDIATNAAMVLAKPAGTNPRALAELLIAELVKLPMVNSADVAGPGFINLRVDAAAWRDELALIHADGADYGRSTIGRGRRVNVEYVSANPTGPMHVGHCRGAVVGDALATLLAFTGHAVTREYYVNDAGGQVDVLARSVFLRYAQALGHTGRFTVEQFPWLENQFTEFNDPSVKLYPGEYLLPVADELAAEFGSKYLSEPIDIWLPIFRARAVAAMMDMIRADLAKLGIAHDLFSSEAELQAAGKPAAAEARLRADGLVYDGMLEAPKGETPEDWEPIELPLFRATQYGDDQDRPIRKSDGSWTYFGADLAYHAEKAARADELIDIWGADHAGTVKRITAAVAALTGGKTRFDVKLVQMVRLLKDGEPFKMSKRAGNFVTLADVVDEVGKDVVRFTMLTRKSDAQMDFDFAKVVEASKDNPVFYVQYAHARIASLGRKVAEAGMDLPLPDAALLSETELALVKLLAQFPRTVESAAVNREPHRIAFYLGEVAAAFHSWWNMGNDRPEARVIIADNAALTAARLYIATGIGQVIRNGLALMGVTAVEELA